MRDLNYSMKQVCNRNRDGSHATRSNRERMLDLVATQINLMGYRDAKTVQNLKPKHVHQLVEKWQKEGITVGTIKNRMSYMRWLAEKTGNTILVKPTNEA